MTSNARPARASFASRFAFAIVAVGCVLAGTPARRPLDYSDLPSHLQTLLVKQGTTAKQFPALLHSIERETAARLREGESEHLIYFLLQSTLFTPRPRIEPALSAREFVDALTAEARASYLAGQLISGWETRIPTAVKARMLDFIGALSRPLADERMEWFRKSLSARERNIHQLSAEYALAMRFLYQKEFVYAKNDGSLYQQRGHSSDTRIESSYAVWTALSVLKRVDPALRMNRVLIVGPGLDFAPRTALIDSYPPQSYQPWAIADALLELGLAEPRQLRIQSIDINDRVLEFFHDFPARRQPRLTLFATWEDPEYVAYFHNLGRRIGTEVAVPGGKLLQISREAMEYVTAGKLNVITERYDPSPQYDLIVATNVFVYFDNRQLLLALSNVHGMLASGGYLIHNELRPEVETYTGALGFAPARAGTVRLSLGAGRPLFDSFVIHRKRIHAERLAAPQDHKAIKIVLVGDSTVNDEGGWGPGLRASFSQAVQVINLARNGRSSKSFRDEGLWQPALAAKPDYILLQFGHNDGPGKGPERETDPRTTYRQNMIRYIDEARAAGAVPVLVTSIVRRIFTDDGKIKPDSLVPYVEEIRVIASEKSVPLIDLYSLTRAQAEQAGPAGAVTIGRQLPNGRQDTTHLGPTGQREIGRIAAREFARLEPAVQPFLLAESLAPVH